MTGWENVAQGLEFHRAGKSQILPRVVKSVVIIIIKGPKMCFP